MEREKSSGRRLHVIVVKDHPLASHANAAVSEDGYETSLTHTSTTAIQRLRGGGIDLALLDGTWPDETDVRLNSRSHLSTFWVFRYWRTSCAGRACPPQSGNAF